MSGEAVFEGSCGLSYVLVSGSASLTFYEVYYIGVLHWCFGGREGVTGVGGEDSGCGTCEDSICIGGVAGCRVALEEGRCLRVMVLRISGGWVLQVGGL